MRSSFPAVQFPKLGHTRGALMRAALPYLLRGQLPPTSSQLQLPFPTCLRLLSALSTLLLYCSSFSPLSTPITVYSSHPLLFASLSTSLFLPLPLCYAFPGTPRHRLSTVEALSAPLRNSMLLIAAHSQLVGLVCFAFPLSSASALRISATLMC